MKNNVKRLRVLQIVLFTRFFTSKTLKSRYYMDTFFVKITVTFYHSFNVDNLVTNLFISSGKLFYPFLSFKIIQLNFAKSALRL